MRPGRKNRNPPAGELLDRLRDARGWKCERCGGRGVRRGQHPGLEFAHTQPTALSKIPRGRGSRARYYDIRKHPAAYALLCKVCHGREDLRVLTDRAKEKAAREPGMDADDMHEGREEYAQDEVPF